MIIVSRKPFSEEIFPRKCFKSVNLPPRPIFCSHPSQFHDLSLYQSSTQGGIQF